MENIIFSCKIRFNHLESFPTGRSGDGGSGMRNVSDNRDGNQVKVEPNDKANNPQQPLNEHSDDESKFIIFYLINIISKYLPEWYGSI